MTDCLMVECMFRDTIKCPCASYFNRFPTIGTSNGTIMTADTTPTILSSNTILEKHEKEQL